MEELQDIVSNIAVYSTAFPLILVTVLFLTRKLDLKMFPIFFLLIASFGCDQLGRWMRDAYQNNMPVSHIYGFLHAAMLFWFFSLVIPNAKKFLFYFGIFYLVLYTGNTLFHEPILTYNSTAKVFQNLTFLVIGFWYFFSIYNSESLISIEKNGVFWLVVALFVYHSGSLFTFLMSSRILQINDGSLFSTWIIHNIFHILKNALFVVGLWLGRKV